MRYCKIIQSTDFNADMLIRRDKSAIPKQVPIHFWRKHMAFLPVLNVAERCLDDPYTTRARLARKTLGETSDGQNSGSCRSGPAFSIFPLKRRDGCRDIAFTVLMLP